MELLVLNNNIRNNLCGNNKWQYLKHLTQWKKKEKIDIKLNY